MKTKQPIKAGEFILEYVGEVVSEKEFKDRMASIYVNDKHHYCLHLDGGLVIDGHRMGGDGNPFWELFGISFFFFFEVPNGFINRFFLGGE